jgi:DNA-directed RNA polymerase
MDRLAFHTREQFVEMHEAGLVNKLAIEWAERYPKCSFPELPAMGNLNLREVMNSEYFFS